MDFKIRLFYLLILVQVISVPSLVAKGKTVTAENKCVMGENDSRNDVRKMCFLWAKRKVLNQAGVYIESTTIAKNYRLSKDEISSYSAALLQVETITEKWDFVGDNLVFKIKVKADVDTGYLEKQLEKIQKDTNVQSKIKLQQSKLQRLENQVLDLQRQLGSVDSVQAATLRKDRNVVFKKIDSLQAKKLAIMEKIESASKNVVELIELNMTQKEVISLIGEPRSSKFSWTWNYGKYWIVWVSGLVECITKVKTNCRGSNVIK